MVDYPGKLAATVFTGGCNLRCPFCHNALLVTRLGESPTITEEEVLSFLSSRRGLLDAMVLSGGEPLIQPDAADFLEKVRNLGFSIKLDTNGTNPQLLRRLIDEGLVDYVAMDVKNGPDHYAETVGIEGFSLAAIEESIRILLEDKTDYELRTTVVLPLHSEDSIAAMAAWLTALGDGKKVKRLYLQPFVDRDTVPVAGLCAPEADTLSAFVGLLQSCADYVTLRGV